MAELTWSEGFSVGIQLMDDQHKRLIDLINATDGSCDERTMIEAIQSMFEYAEHHFHDEEDMLRNAHYPELTIQMNDHRSFIAKARDFASRDLNNPKVCAELNTFLCTWLSHHILEVDMKYKHFLLPAK